MSPWGRPGAYHYRLLLTHLRAGHTSARACGGWFLAASGGYARAHTLRNRGGIMRTFPMRLLLSAVMVAAFAGTSVGANAGSSTASKVGPLKLCTYSTGDLNEGSQVLIVKVVAVGGRGVRGTLRVVAA